MKKFLSLYLLLSGQLLFAVDFPKAAKEIEQELLETNQQLSEARKTIFNEREKLTQTISQNKDTLAKKEKSSAELRKELAQIREEMAQLEKEIAIADNNEINLLEESLNIRRELAAQIPQIQIQNFQKSFEAQDVALVNKNLGENLKLYSELQGELLDSGFKLTIRKSQVIDEKGAFAEGDLISLGLARTYLLVNNLGGMAEMNPHHNYPDFKELAGSSTGLQAIVNGGQGDVIFDFSNGLAFKKEAKQKSLREIFFSGGVIMYPISLLAILSLLVGTWKTIQLYLVRSHFDAKVEKIVSLIAENKISEAQEFIKTLKSPLRKIMEEALLHRSTTRENLEELLNENILAQIPKLDRFLPVLSVSAGAAPLLGLLGTVMGIITTFEMISLYGTGDPNTMAGGISEALITTEAGLMVAIPALLWHAILNRRLKTIVGNLEKASLGFINMLFLGKGKNELD